MVLLLCILLLVYLYYLLVLPQPPGPLGLSAAGRLRPAIVLCAKLPRDEVRFSHLPLLAPYYYHYYHNRPARVSSHCRRSRRYSSDIPAR